VGGKARPENFREREQSNNIIHRSFLSGNPWDIKLEDEAALCSESLVNAL